VKTWFVSDTHFGHTNIMRLSARPFATIEEMDATLIANWNAAVQPTDDVWHLGDFAFRNAKAASNYLRRLNGRIHLVHGNHDSIQVRESKEWASSQSVAEINVEGERLFLSHYAHRVWPRSHRGAIHLYGHSHGSLPGDRQSCDVGVDCWDYRPVSLTEIKRRLATLPERMAPDYHGRPKP
jgi:calcineurin-like phosphoesterase family protein